MEMEKHAYIGSSTSLSGFEKVCTAYGTEISAEKTKLMTNNTSGINTEIKVNEQNFETAPGLS